MQKAAFACPCRLILGAGLFLGADLFLGTANAAPVTYNLDPNHTFPSFEADHMGGMSILRGKFNSSSGKVVLDRQAKSGTIEVSVDTSTIDFGIPKLNAEAKEPMMFDVAKFPMATYSGKFSAFKGDVPTAAEGTLTLHGVTRAVALTIRQFKCMVNPLVKKEVCGADAEADFDRADFGIDYGRTYGFNMAVKLRIEVEGVRAD